MRNECIMDHIFLDLPVSELQTPAFVIDEDIIEKKLLEIRVLKNRVNCKVLYTLKSLIIKEVLHRMNAHLDGFSASSLFEAQLAADVIGKAGTIHYTSPGLQVNEFSTLSETCDYMAFNSLGQFSQSKKMLSKKTNYGLRINPQKSYVSDPRYDPCCKNSRLGISLKQLHDFQEQEPFVLKGISGIHFHSNCDSTSFVPLLETVTHLLKENKNLMKQIKWMNLGGGYLFEDSTDYLPFYETVSLLKERYDLEVFVEPGASLVRESGFIVASVIDLFQADGVNIAILNTTVNHMPEVFEYQYRPDIVGESSNGKFTYLINGASCLAGDVFGEYTFDEPLKVDDRLIFNHMGAYTFVKMHMFNGINLPTIYLHSKARGLVKKKQFVYEDFLLKIGER